MRASSQPLSRRGRSPIVAAVAAVLLGGAAWLAYSFASRDPRQRLVAAVPRNAREIEPRLSGGFAWAPLRGAVKRGASDEEPQRLVMFGAAGEVLQRADTHAAAIASMLIGNPRNALARLDAAEDKTAAIWSDLAAAHYEIATREDVPEEFSRALAAADAALEIDPNFPEALFNRAVVLQRLGLRDAARVAWQRYLAADASSEWSTEARARLRGLSQEQPSFKRELEVAYERLAAGDRELAARLVADFPQEARQWGETEILGRWGASGDARHLAVARQLGAALAARSGEHLLLDSVKAIDDAADRTTLAAAHVDYRAARILASEQKPGEAEPLLRRAARGFADAKSPMELVARYFAATAAFDQNRIGEARAELEPLRRDMPAGYRALRAGIEWQLGLCVASGARWGEALSLLQASSAAFDALGELDNSNRVRSIVSDVYEAVGETRASWRERLIVLSRLGRVTNVRLQSALAGMSRTAVRTRDWPAAASLLRIEAESGAIVGDRLLQIEAFFRRARVRAENGDAASAREDLAAARRICAAVEDRGLRERCGTDLLYVEGMVASIVSESGADDKLTRAIEFHRQRGRRMYLPEMLLARGRLAARRGDATAAWADVEAGIVEVEQQRETLPAGDVRAGIFDVATELFAEAVSMQLAREDAARALHFAERGRARLLLDSVAGGRTAIPSTVAEWTAGVPAGSVLLNYVALRDGVRIFLADRSGISVVRLSQTLFELSAAARALAEAIEKDDLPAMHARGAALYEAMIAPAAPKIAGVERLIVGGDAALMTVPYAALREPRAGRYLIESHGIVTTPSAAAYLREREAPRALLRVVAVADPQRDDSERLLASAAEAARVARLYPSSAVLTGAEATRQAFLREAATADAIHFAGHGRVGETGADAQLLFTAGKGDSGIMYATELAAVDLRRTSIAVLAACDTAQGAPRAEGVWSMSRALLMAGVPSVVATLWPIDDELAPPFFIKLHRKLRGGLAPRDAVRAAQLECIRSKSAPPSVWASVQVLGI